MSKKVYSPEEARNRFSSLPQEVQTLLYSPDMYAAVTQVAEKNQLHLDQMDILNTETAQVMLGFTEMGDFPQEIARTLSIDPMKASAIAKELNETLFAKIREAMKKPLPATVAPTASEMPSKPALSDILPKGTPTVSPNMNTSSSFPVAQTPIAPPTLVSVTPPAPKVDMHPADVMLTEKTITTVPQVTPPTATNTSVPPAAKKEEALGRNPATGEAPAAGDYKADPYREPVN